MSDPNDALNRRLSHDPTLRELLEQRLNYERSLVNQEFKNLEQALRLQAAEYERRLTVLNHAHEQAIRAQAETVPREMFNSFVKELETWKLENNKWRDIVNVGLRDIASLLTRVSDYENFKLKTSNDLQVIATRSVTWTAAIGVFFLIIGFIFRFLKV